MSPTEKEKAIGITVLKIGEDLGHVSLKYLLDIQVEI